MTAIDNRCSEVTMQINGMERAACKGATDQYTMVVVAAQQYKSIASQKDEKER